MVIYHAPADAVNEMAGASPEQIEANINAANWVLTQEELDEVSLMSFKGL